MCTCVYVYIYIYIYTHIRIGKDNILPREPSEGTTSAAPARRRSSLSSHSIYIYIERERDVLSCNLFQDIIL